ncbi:MAG: DinB family protein [Phycisphaerales bacterium]
MKKSVIDIFDFQRKYLDLLVSDIDDGAMCAQPSGFRNHPAWQLGHMALAIDNFGKLAGGDSCIDDEWRKTFGMNTNPDPDRAKYPSKDELLAKYDECRSNCRRALEEASESHLNARPAHEQTAEVFGTNGNAIVFGMLSHESMHLGQLAAWRRAKGMCEALSRR